MGKRKHNVASLAPRPQKDEDEEEQHKEKRAHKDAEEDPSSSSSSDDSDAFPSEDEQDDATSEDDEDGAAFKSIDVDFGCFDPQEPDFHGLKTLLTNYLDGKQWACSEVVEEVIAAPVGGVVKCGEDEDPIGVVSMLALDSKKAKKALNDIKEFLKDRCPAGMSSKLTAAWTAPGTALLISERLLNCPPQLAPPLMESLFSEVGEKLSKKQQPKQYLMVARAYKDPRSTSTDLIYATPEGEFLAKHATWTFDFPVPNRAVGKDDLEPQRVVAVVPAKAVGAAMREMNAAVAMSG